MLTPAPTLHDHRDPRDWKRPWRDPPGFFFPACNCCGGAPSHSYTTYGGTTTGGTNLQDTQQYQIDAWTAKTSMPSNARYSSCAEFLTTAAYVMLGSSSASPFFLTRTDSYTPDTWTTKASNSVARQQSASFPLGGYAFVAGGIDANLGTVKAETYCYDPEGDAWSTKTSLPQTEYDAFGFGSGNHGYIVGGFHSPSYQNKNYQYDASAGSWTTKTVLPTARSTGSRGMFLGGLGYCAGGIHVGGIIGTNEAYDESGNSWATKSSMTTARIFMGACETDGSTGYTTGGQSTSAARTTTHEEFTPNAWTTRTGVTTTRQTNFSARA